MKERAFPRTTLKVVFLTVLAYLWSAADDIPFVWDWLETARTGYPFNLATHTISLVFFALAVT